MSPQSKKFASRPVAELRRVLLQYFYDRNSNATSTRGKKGFSVKITDIRKALKASHNMSREEVIANLNYLMSQGWIEEEQVQKSFSTSSGTVVPSSTSYYKISAAGIDKIEGEGEFTMDKFKGIRIEATGQNIITIGDGNQVNAQFETVAESLVELKEAILKAKELAEEDKVNIISDIDSIESQLAKSKPNSSVIKAAWEGIKELDTLAGVGEKVVRAAGMLAGLL